MHSANGNGSMTLKPQENFSTNFTDRNTRNGWPEDYRKSVFSSFGNWPTSNSTTKSNLSSNTYSYFKNIHSGNVYSTVSSIYAHAEKTKPSTSSKAPSKNYLKNSSK